MNPRLRKLFPEPLRAARGRISYGTMDYGFSCEVDPNHSVISADRKRLAAHGALYTLCRACTDEWLDNVSGGNIFTLEEAVSSDVVLQEQLSKIKDISRKLKGDSFEPFMLPEGFRHYGEKLKEFFEGDDEVLKPNELGSRLNLTSGSSVKFCRMLVALGLMDETTLYSYGSGNVIAFKINRRALELGGGYTSLFNDLNVDEEELRELKFYCSPGGRKLCAEKFPMFSGFVGPVEPPEQRRHRSWDRYRLRADPWTEITDQPHIGSYRWKKIEEFFGLDPYGMSYFSVDTLAEALSKPNEPILLGGGTEIPLEAILQLSQRAARLDFKRFRVYFKKTLNGGIPYMVALSEHAFSEGSEGNFTEEWTDLFRGDFDVHDDFKPTSRKILYLAYGLKNGMLACYAGYTSMGLRHRTMEHLRANDYDFEFAGSLAWELPATWGTAPGASESFLGEGLLIHSMAKTIDLLGGWLQNKQYPSKLRGIAPEAISEVNAFMYARVYPLIEERFKLTVSPEEIPVAIASLSGESVFAYRSGSKLSDVVAERQRRLNWPTAKLIYR